MAVLEVAVVVAFVVAGMFTLACFVGSLLERAGRHYPPIVEPDPDVVAHGESDEVDAA
jgi:hypothetical protein